MQIVGGSESRGLKCAVFNVWCLRSRIPAFSMGLIEGTGIASTHFTLQSEKLPCIRFSSFTSGTAMAGPAVRSLAAWIRHGQAFQRTGMSVSLVISVNK